MRYASHWLVILALGAMGTGILSSCGSELSGTDNDTVGSASADFRRGSEDDSIVPAHWGKRHHRRGRDGLGRGDATPASSTDSAPTCPGKCTPAACSAVEPSDPLITDWKDVDTNGLFVDNDSYRQPNQNWWLTFFGGPYVYPAIDPCSDSKPAYPLTQTIQGVWNVQGTVGTWSGFGLWFAPCMVDMSAYRGVSFTLWGDVGSTGTVTMGILTSQDIAPTECFTNVGTCDSATGKCSAPSHVLSVPGAQGEPITLLWSDFTGGSPMAGIDPSQIVGFHWFFDRVEWGGTVTPPFPVNVSVGEIRLIP